jgi:nucleoside 2-deoxyribosyltransferase
MRVYVSSAFHHMDFAAQAASILQQLGHSITLEWWLLEANLNFDSSVSKVEKEACYQKMAEQEVQAVRDADVVVQVGPGRRGAAVEMGACLGLGKPAALVIPADCLVEDYDNVHVFFYHRLVTTLCIGSMCEDDVTGAITTLHAMLPRMLWLATPQPV